MWNLQQTPGGHDRDIGTRGGGRTYAPTHWTETDLLNYFKLFSRINYQLTIDFMRKVGIGLSSALSLLLIISVS